MRTTLIPVHDHGKTLIIIVFLYTSNLYRSFNVFKYYYYWIKSHARQLSVIDERSEIARESNIIIIIIIIFSQSPIFCQMYMHIILYRICLPDRTTIITTGVLKSIFQKYLIYVIFLSITNVFFAPVQQLFS